MLDRRNYLKISAVAVNAIMVSGTTIAQTGATNNKQSDTTSVYSNNRKNSIFACYLGQIVIQPELCRRAILAGFFYCFFFPPRASTILGTA